MSASVGEELKAFYNEQETRKPESNNHLQFFRYRNSTIINVFCRQEACSVFPQFFCQSLKRKKEPNTARWVTCYIDARLSVSECLWGAMHRIALTLGTFFGRTFSHVLPFIMMKL